MKSLYRRVRLGNVAENAENGKIVLLTVLRSDRDLISGVLHDLVGFVGGVHSNAVVIADKHDAEGAVLQHPGELSLPFANG